MATVPNRAIFFTAWTDPTTSEYFPVSTNALITDQPQLDRIVAAQVAWLDPTFDKTAPGTIGGTTPGPAFFTAINGGPLAGRRNMVINGDFNVAQRGTSFSAPAGVYTLDRWIGTAPGGTLQRVEDGPDARTRYACELIGTSGNDAILSQRIEADIAKAAASQTVTISADIKAVAGAGQAALVLSTADARDNFTVATPRLFSLRTLTSGWLRYSASVTLTADAANGLELRVDRDGDGGAHTTRIANIQLEIGGVATPFEPTFKTQEELLCWRYFFRHGAFGSPFRNFGSAVAQSSTRILLPNPNPVEMRASPSLVSSGAFSAYGMTDDATASSITSALNARGGSILYDGSDFTRGGYYIRAENDGAAYFDLIAEL